MGLGILEPGVENVPGTSTILDRDDPTNVAETGPLNPNLKYDTTGKIPIVLVPQPSDDPNDPLNWSLLKRDLILVVLCLISVIATTLSPILAADSFTLTLDLGETFTRVALLTGYHLLGVGVGGFLFVPSARVWGKRHLYILGTIIVIFSSAWGGASKGYTSLLWSRIFQGIGLAPFEALVNASVGDMYFVHERGKRMAMATISLFGAAFFTPVIVGKISLTPGLGVPWTFYFVAIFAGVLLPAVIFFVPETAFVRSARLNTDFGRVDYASAEKSPMRVSQQGVEENGESSEGKEGDSTMEGLYSGLNAGATTNPAVPAAIPEKESYWRSLRPFNGRKTNESYFKLLIRPLPLFLHPGILWACLTQGVLIGWTVLIGVVLGGLLTYQPPLFWTPLEVGYMYSSAFIGSIIGFVLVGIISDPMAKWLTKLNKGVYEPEFRLVIALPQLFFGCLGLYGFGWTVEGIGEKYPWIVPEVFLGFVLAGLVCGAAAAALYLCDAHREIAIEAFTCMMVFKNVFSFALTFDAFSWVRLIGPKKLFIIIGSVQVGVCVLAWFLYVFGKINRAFFAKHDILAILGLR